jgi:hypothetical protein
MSYLSRTVAAAKLALNSNAPTILVVGGVVAMGAGAVVACKKTLEVEEVVAPAVELLEKCEESVGNKMTDGSTYDDEKFASDRRKIYTRTALGLGRHYLVPTVLFVGGACMVFRGHNMMLQRNATLAVAFTSVSNAFSKYRERVVHNFGSETDQAMMNGHVVKEVYDDASGTTEVIHTRDWAENPNGDPYNRVFSEENSKCWQPDLSANKLFIQQQMRFAQQKLIAQDYLFLADVYEALGFPVNDISRVVGWKVSKKPDGTKDIPLVDFGLDKPHPDDWKYDREASIYLDFNCHGLIIGGSVQRALEKAL